MSERYAAHAVKAGKAGRLCGEKKKKQVRVATEPGKRDRDMISPFHDSDRKGLDDMNR
jgi:hypothetical protein